MKLLPKAFLDGITSLTNKLTNSRNPHANNTITATRLDPVEMRAIYRSGMGSKIYRLKTGIALNDTMVFESTADQEFYNAKLAQVVKDAAKHMLGFGRGLVVLFEPGADLSSRLGTVRDPAKLRIRSFSGDMVFVQAVKLDLSSPDYLRPTMYSVRGQQIHPSRCVDFNYIMPPEIDLPEYHYGGQSEAELIRNELINDQIVQRAVPAMLEKSSTMFYKVEGFKDLLQSNQEDTIVGYFAALENLRSIYGAGIIDANDAVEAFSQALTNLAESDMITLRRIAMVSGLPLSWLVGEAARGLNSTGEGERQVLMQTITSLQSDYLLSPINRLMALCGQGVVKFKENQGESPTDRVTYEKTAAEVATILYNLGEDSEKYLQDKGVTQDDPIADFFSVDDDSEQSVSEGDTVDVPDIDLTALLGNRDEFADEFNESKVKRDDDGKFSKSSGTSGKEKNKNERGVFPESKPGNTQFAKTKSLSKNLKYAESEGFDTDNVYTHRTDNENLDEIKSGQRFKGIFTVENDDAGDSYGKYEYKYVLKDEPWSESDVESKANDNYEDTAKFLSDKFGKELSEDEVDLLISAIGGDFSDSDELMEITDSIDEADLYSDLQNLQADIAIKYGASALRMDDEFGDSSVMILPGDGAMNVYRPGVEDDEA